MQILFTRFPLESANGGLENQTAWLAEGLQKKGHDVSFLGSCPVLLEKFSQLTAHSLQLLIGIPPVTKWGAVSFLWRKKAMEKKLQKAFSNWLLAIGHKSQANSQQPIAIMLSLSEKLLLTSWLRNQGVRVLWIEHDRVGRWLRKNPWLSLLRRESAHATIVCVSELSKKLYEELGFDPDKIVVIPNGVPVKSQRTPRPSENVLHIGSVARLSPEKGLDVLIESITDLPEISLTIVGTGPDEGRLRQMIHQDTERLGIGSPRIHLVQHIDDLTSFYDSLDIFVLPSTDHDPFGLVAAEAMMRGVATIVTDACGIAGYLQNGSDALVVPENDSGALKEAILVLKDPEKRKSIEETGHEKAFLRFGLQQMIDAYEKILSVTH